MNLRDIPSNPLPGLRAPFDTHRLQREADGTILLRRSIGVIILFSIFLACGPSLIYLIFRSHEYNILIFSVTYLVILFNFFRSLKTTRIDPLARELKIGGEVFSFDRIAALQVVPAGGSYQLNLVTVDGKRRNLIPSGKGRIIRAIAREAAAASGKIPVIDRQLEFTPRAAENAIRAENLNWDPVAPGGASFQTHRLLPTPYGGYTFKPSFRIIGFVMLIPLFLIVPISARGGFWSLVTGLGVWFIILPWSVIFSIALCFYCNLRSRQPIFDPTERMFYRGSSRRDPVPLDDIVALQILSEFCHMDKGGSFRSYELNLVLTNNRRVNVVDHGNPNQLRSDAETLAEFLKVPLFER